MARWTGELAEYMQRSKERQAGDKGFTEGELILLNSGNPRDWLQGLQSYTLRWVEQHHAEFSEHLAVGSTPLKESPQRRLLSAPRSSSLSVVESKCVCKPFGRESCHGECTL